MQALQDHSKKSTIFSLLNPQDSSVSALPYSSVVDASGDASQSHSHAQRTIGYAHTLPSSDYSLRKATWESDDRAHGMDDYPRSQYASYHPSRMNTSYAPGSYYQNQQYHYAERSIVRSDRVEERYFENGHQWQHQTYTGSSPYPASFSYSNANNGQPGDYRYLQDAQSNYREHSDAPIDTQAYQSSERASVRLAARGTVPEQTSGVQAPRFSQSPPVTTPHDHAFISYSAPGLYPQQQPVIVPAVSPQPQGVPSETTPAKRPLPDAEAPTPKPKRAKDRGKTTTLGTQEASTTSTASRRGYNAKKRQEAANIAAQNAIAFRNVLGPDGSTSGLSLNGITILPELQFARCMSARYKDELFSRCVACTRRWAGDTCRFQGIRYIIRDQRQRFVGVSFNENFELTETSKMEFPTKWNRKLNREHIQRLKLSIAKALLPTLKIEQKHMSTTKIIRRQRETDVRVTCDTCMTSLFSTSFMCRECGREVCNECFQTVCELTQADEPEATADELVARRKLREKHAHANPFFLSCLKRNEHGINDFLPVTRFTSSELNRAAEEMEDILNNLERNENELEAVPHVEGRTYSDVDPSASFPDPVASPVYDDFTPANTPAHVTSIPIYRAQTIPASYYDPCFNAPNPAFSSLWEKGRPLLVKDVLPRFQLTWNPEYFMEKYGDQNCIVIECQTDQNQKMSIREFFKLFGEYENRTDCWKLKDWPPTAELKTAFPELFDDFSNAVPVPDYVRRDGVYNIGSHFPSNALGPDLGPKMYNSMASSQEAGSKGSTRLHMDMADAFNVMFYASNCADGTPGYAIWDLFRAEDSDRIREFLRKKFTPGSAAMAAMTNGQQQQTQAEKAAALQNQAIAIHDPIHSQQFYLDVELRRQLWEEYEVKSYRLYQRPGEGVFIPAGCAHQVANMADCMKIAIDFVSPENIDRCEKLTKEFREQNQRKAWKEDVLQLRTMMWFAWQSCAKKELELNEDETALGGQLTVLSSKNGVEPEAQSAS